MSAVDNVSVKAMRPAITGLFACGSAFWAACACAYSVSQGLQAVACLKLGLGMAGLCAAAAISCVITKGRVAGMTIAFALMGACLGFSAAASCHTASNQLQDSGYVRAEVVLIGDSRQASTGECAFVQMECGDAGLVTVYADFGQADPFLRGDRVRVAGNFVAADWGTDSYLWQNGAAGRLRVKACEQIEDMSPISWLLTVRSSMIRIIGSDDDVHTLVQALVCGYRRNISGTALYANFQACGLAHLVAVSGAHLVIVTGLVAVLLRTFRVPRRVSIVVLIGLMGSYLVVSGMPVSAIRATVMSSVGILSLLGRRRPSALNALGLGMITIVGVSPEASVSASFALSALSTAGIVLFAPLVESWFAGSCISKAPFVADALALTLSSAVLSQPLACSLFHQLPLVAPLANIVCAPLFPFACGAGLVAGIASYAMPFCAPLASGLGAFPTMLLAETVKVLSEIPYASVPVSVSPIAAIALSMGMAAAMWLAWPSFKVRIALPIACVVMALLCAFAFGVAQEDAIVMLDVGQGDAFLVRSRGATLLIDTGNHDSQLLEQLAESGTFRLNTVLLTHDDDDHCGSLDALERGVDVDRVVLASGMLDSSSEKNAALVALSNRVAHEVVGVRYGGSFKVGAFTATVVWPQAFTDDGGNADSVCLALDYDGDSDGIVDFRALMTGDAEAEQLDVMIDAGAVGSVDVLKVGHHGSRNGMTRDQVEVLSPRIALIGVGAGNRYGHPAAEVIDMLEDQECQVYRSDRDGQVKCRFTPDSLSVGLQWAYG